MPVLTPAAPKIQLNNSGATASQIDVIQGSSYAACSSGVLPTAAGPCELGATAISYTGANLTSRVVACPPASCIQTGCSGATGHLWQSLQRSPRMWPQAAWTSPGQWTDAHLTCCGSVCIGQAPLLFSIDSDPFSCLGCGTTLPFLSPDPGTPFLAGQEFDTVGLANCRLNTSRPVGYKLNINFFVMEPGLPMFTASVNRTLTIRCQPGGTMCSHLAKARHSLALASHRFMPTLIM